MKEHLYETEGVVYSIIQGQNSQENWEILESSSVDDIWFHLLDSSSCHLILKNNNGRVPRKVLKRCCYLCKINTNSSKVLKRCSVMYSRVGNVSKGLHVGSVICDKYNVLSV